MPADSTTTKQEVVRRQIRKVHTVRRQYTLDVCFYNCIHYTYICHIRHTVNPQGIYGNLRLLRALEEAASRSSERGGEQSTARQRLVASVLSPKMLYTLNRSGASSAISWIYSCLSIAVCIAIISPEIIMGVDGEENRICK